jgi:hypothetical protein
MLDEQVASLSTEQHYPAQYTNNSKTMCPRPAPGQQFTCSKNIFQFTWPKKDAEKKVEKTWSQNKADKTNKLPVLKF